MPTSIPESTIRYYHAYGLVIASELDLGPGANVAPANIDVIIRYAAVPDDFPDSSLRTQTHEIANGDKLLLKVPGIGRFLAASGCVIEIEPAENTSAPRIRSFVLGTLMSAILHQRGLTPFHASAIQVADEAVLFLGKSGSGKSTLAAYLNRCEYPLLNDDVCALQIDNQGAPFLLPGFPRIKLWQDAMQKLDLPREESNRLANRVGKYEMPLSSGSIPASLPVHRAYELRYTLKGEEPGITTLASAASMDRWLRMTFRERLASALGNAEPRFQTCSSLTQQVRLAQLSRKRGLDGLGRVLEMLETDWKSQGVTSRAKSRPLPQLTHRPN